jgi:hypothetical protein
MTLRRAFRPLRPDLDGFLFAQVGEEIGGVPLSVISGLTRLGLDPWEEAGRLSLLGDHEAAEQLARLIAEMPGESHGLNEARVIAIGLVGLLPKRDASPVFAPQMQIRRRYWPCPLRFGRRSYFWVACFALMAVALLNAVTHRGLPFGLSAF